jgi:DNA-binding LacI/PurR family transcriptional regulator
LALAHGATSGSLEERCVTLRRAVDEILRARQASSTSPYFFVVGAGISTPHVPVAREIVEHCKRHPHARSNHAPEFDGPLDEYSYWFRQAYGSANERQRYLSKLINACPISVANRYLASLLVHGDLGKLVVTPNFDDCLQRSLKMLGNDPLLCDHEGAKDRISHPSSEVQIVHVHGRHQFYDLANLRAELADVAKGGMLSLLTHVLRDTAPLVLGYSGWDGDVIMTALRGRLERQRHRHCAYWFCYRASELETLPEWLLTHEDVRFVLPEPVAEAPSVLRSLPAAESLSRLCLATGINPGLFFETDGPLPSQHPSYIERAAENSLLQAIDDGQYQYIAGPRHSGRSSLMNRLQNRLRARWPVQLSMGRIGGGAAEEGVYLALALALFGVVNPGASESTRRALHDDWRSLAPLSPVERMMQFLESWLPNVEKPLVVVLDNIDALKPEFLATFLNAIRECDIARKAPQGAVFDNISFVLVGSGLPSKLLAGTQGIPYTAGKTIELPDFTLEEVRHFAEYLHGDRDTAVALLGQVMHWTSGQPYLTQLLCGDLQQHLRRNERIAAEDVAKVVESRVDALLGDLTVREKHLRPLGRLIRENLLETLLFAILEQPGVRYEPSSPVQADLLGSGLVRVERGALKIRNRFYARALMAPQASYGLGRPREGLKPAAVGLIVNSLSEPYQEALLNSVADAAAKHDARILVLVGGPLREGDGSEPFYRLADQRSLTGLIVASGTLGATAEQIESFCGTLPALPLVSIGVDIKDRPSIGLQDLDREGVRQAMAHLHRKHNARRILFLAGPPENQQAATRLAAYRTYVEEHGLEALEIVAYFRQDLAERECKAQLLNGKRFDAVFAANDEMAMGALNALHDERLDAIPVVGFDDIAASLLALPPLTTVRQPLAEISQHALQQVLFHEPPTGNLPGIVGGKGNALVVRESCGCPLRPAALVDGAGGNLLDALHAMLDRYGLAPINVEGLASAYAAYADTRKRASPAAARSEFLERLRELTRSQGARGELEIVAFQYAIDVLAAFHDGSVARDAAARLEAEELWRLARAHLLHLERRLRLRARAAAANQGRVLIELTSALLAKRDPLELGEVLRQVMPDLGIHTCCVCRYEGEASTAREPMAKVMLHLGSAPELEELAAAGEIMEAGNLLSKVAAALGRAGALVYPLRVYDRSVGFVVFQRDPSVGAAIYGQLAEQLGAAVYAAELTEQTERSLHTFAALPELVSGFVDPSAPEMPHLREVLAVCAKLALEVLGGEPVIVYELVDGRFRLDRRGPVHAGELRHEDKMRSAVVEIDDVAAQVATHRQHRFFGAREYGRHLASMESFEPDRFAYREKIRAMSALVLEAGNEVVGVMFVNYRSEREFSDWDMALHKAFASHVAFAIRYMRTVSRVATDTHAVLGKVLNPLSTGILERLGNISSALSQRTEQGDEQTSATVQRILTGLENDARWFAEAYDPKTIEEVPIERLLQVFDEDPLATVGTDVADIRVLTKRTHLQDVAQSLFRTARAGGASRVTVHARIQDVGWLELRFEYDGKLPTSRDGIFVFDQKRDLYLPSFQRDYDEHRAGHARTLWWCRIAMLATGGWLALAPTEDVTFVLRFPLAPGSWSSTPEAPLEGDSLG